MLFVNDGLTSGWARCGCVLVGAEDSGAEAVGAVGDAIPKGIDCTEFGDNVRAVQLDLFRREDARAWRIVALFAAVIAVGLIVSTYHVFNNMYDEPAHIAAGMEWLSKGTYTYEPQHPPLGRVAAALGPYLAGERAGDWRGQMYEEGRRILGQGAHYERMLMLARLGELPFFLILAFTTWFWARRVADERTAALAVVFVCANPNVLAHAGVAGTDIGPGSLMPAALLAWAMWLERASWRRSVAMGTLVALCGLTKFNGLAYLIPAAIAVGVMASAGRARSMWNGTRGRALALAVGVAMLVTWATYRFSVGAYRGVTLPAPELFAGLAAFFHHGTGGHPAYLFGRVRLGGWWYYDLVAVLVKTPIPQLLLGGLGAFLVGKQLRVLRHGVPTIAEQRMIEAAALLMGIASVLVVASATPVDIGIRLLLGMYPLLAVLSAMGFVWAWEHAGRASNRFAVGALLLWTLIEVGAAHPDYIAYFNQLAGPEPERVLVDSNLDWGQDLYRLRDAANDLKMDSLRVHYFGTAEFSAVGLTRTRRLRPNERATGWVAASETFYAGVWADTALNWLHAYRPVGRVGKSIRLYYIKN